MEWEGGKFGDYMQVTPEKLLDAIKRALEDKGKRKFRQSVEMIINFRNVDFSKPENRLNITLKLPRGRGKENKIVVVGDESLTYEAKKLGVEKTFTPEEVTSTPPKEIKKLAKDHVFLIHPKFIGIVAKHWGKILGPRGKVPQPLVGKLEKVIEAARHQVRIQNRGKYLPTLQVLIGTEDMEPTALLENAQAVLEEITKKHHIGTIKSIYFKLTMGRPAKVI